MKNKILPLTLAMIGCLALPASADILIPNGDFSNGSTNWLRVDGAGEGPATTVATGGNPGGYATITPAGGWGILVSPTVAGNAGGGVPISSLSLTAGGPVTFTFDSKIISGASSGPVGNNNNAAGFKWEAWGGNALVGNTGDQRFLLTGDGTTWETYTYDWTLPALTETIIFVPLANYTAGAIVGLDNVGVVPEPSTYALLALGAMGLGTHLVRRRRRQG
jgi:PEP-CTERM motif